MPVNRHVVGLLGSPPAFIMARSWGKVKPDKGGRSKDRLPNPAHSILFKRWVFDLLACYHQYIMLLRVRGVVICQLAIAITV